MGNKLQQSLWKLANYDNFFMHYCPAQYNKAAGIGMFFIFQMVIVFISVITTYHIIIFDYMAVGCLIGIFVTYIFYRWMKLMNEMHHNAPRSGVFLFQLVINSNYALVLTVPFSVALFKNQILFEHFLRTGTLEYGGIEKLWLLPIGLYNSWFLEREGTVILLICIAIFMMIAFVMITPYFLIYNGKNSNYTLVKQNYEQKFH